METFNHPDHALNCHQNDFKLLKIKMDFRNYDCFINLSLPKNKLCRSTL